MDMVYLHFLTDIIGYRADSGSWVKWVNKSGWVTWVMGPVNP